MLEYNWNPYYYISDTIVYGVILALSICVIVVCLFLKKQHWGQVFWWAVVTFCVFSIISGTILGRIPSEAPQLELHLFWTLKEAIETGNDLYWYYIVGNITLFMPLGIALGFALPRPAKHWWIALLLGLLLSTGIELTQYVLHLGLCELDDLLHNGIGCLLGYFISWFFLKIGKAILKK